MHKALIYYRYVFSICSILPFPPFLIPHDSSSFLFTSLLLIYFSLRSVFRQGYDDSELGSSEIASILGSMIGEAVMSGNFTSELHLAAAAAGTSQLQVRFLFLNTQYRSPTSR